MSKSLVMDHLPIESDGITPFNRSASPKIDVIPNKQPLPELTTRPTPMQDVFIGNNNMLTHKTFDSSRQVMPINSSIQSLPIKTLQETPQAKYTTIPEKVSIVSAQAADVITHLKSCARMSANTKNLLDIDKLHIKESTYLNKALNQVKYDIQQVIFEKDGWFSRGGKFIGLRSHKDVEKIKTIIANFEKTVEAWKTNTELIRQDIVHDKTRTSPLFLKDEPYNRHWDFIINENDFNRDLFRMRNLMERQDFQAACEIVENYKGRIPYTKEGWIADTPEFREHAKLQTFYQQEYSHYQKEMVNDVNHPKNTINFDLLKTLEGVDPNLGLDFVSSAKQTLTDSTYDTKLFAELMRDEQLGPILREAFGKETFITADYSIKQPSLYEQCDTFLKDYHQACNQVQQVVLNEESTLKKYGIIGNTEIHKKAIEFGQAFLHPQETAQEIWHGLENIAKFCHRFAEIDTHLEFGELDLARQKSQELTQGISATFDALNALSHEEKFKLIIDFFFDWKVGNKLFDQAFNIAGSLKNAAKEIATITSKLELVPEQAQKLAVLSKTCEKRAVQIERLRNTLIEVAIKREKEFLTASSQLPRTAERAMKEFELRVARLTLQYGKETVDEALTLFDVSDQSLLKNIKLLDCIEHSTESLYKINSNPRWKTFKYDSAKGGKVTLGSIDEAIAGIACEEQKVMGNLNRSFHQAGDFIEISNKRLWDVKTAKYYSIDGKCIYNCEEFLKSINKALLYNPNEFLIIDLTFLPEIEINNLIDKLKLSYTEDNLKRIIVIHTKNPSIIQKFMGL